MHCRGGQPLADGTGPLPRSPQEIASSTRSCGGPVVRGGHPTTGHGPIAGCLTQTVQKQTVASLASRLHVKRSDSQEINVDDHALRNGCSRGGDCQTAAGRIVRQHDPHSVDGRRSTSGFRTR